MSTMAKLVLSEKHPMNGQMVEVVRKDPFKRFVIVLVLKTVGDYKNGTEMTVKPEQVEG